MRRETKIGLVVGGAALAGIGYVFAKAMKDVENSIDVALNLNAQSLHPDWKAFKAAQEAQSPKVS